MAATQARVVTCRMAGPPWEVLAPMLADAPADAPADACPKGGEHAFRVVAPRRWGLLRSSLRKLYLGPEAPWDADDEKEAKAAAAAERRRVVCDEDGRLVKSRRQGKKEEQSAALAAAAAAAAKSAPEGWGRPAKRHPAASHLRCACESWRRCTLKEARVGATERTLTSREDVQ